MSLEVFGIIVGFIVATSLVVYWILNFSPSTDDDIDWEDGDK